jgi:rhodanese-related sulfurtransferase
MRVKKVLVVTAVAVAILISVPASCSFASSPGDHTIDTGLLHAMVVENAYRMEAGRKMKFMIIDARSPEEYNESHVFGAISIPEKDFEKALRLLPGDKTALMVVYCNDRKCVRSRRWATKAFAAGYSNVVVYSDGFPYWQEKHMPVAALRTIPK